MAIVKVTSENFKTEVLESDKTVLLDFYAVWCGPCQMLSPVMEEIAKEHPEYKICKIDVDDDGVLAQQFGIASIPTLIVMKNGEVANMQVGYTTKAAILKMME